MFLRQIMDESLAQNAYLIGCQRSGEAVVVDPERDIERYIKLAEANGLRLTAVADTHIHADYLSGARELVQGLGLRGYFSAEGGADWQFEWAQGLDNVQLLRDGDVFKVGNIEIKALLTPGHTPEHLSFLVTDYGGGADQPMALLSGDFIFVGDVGRPDLLESAAGQVGAMEPAARQLYQSLRGISELPGFVQILPGHGAGSACGKALGAIPNSVLDYERQFNSALRLAAEGAESDFIEVILDGQPEPPLYFARMKRDNRLGPALLPGGKLPAPERIDQSQLKAWCEASDGVILDLRTDFTEFMKRRLKNSLLTPLMGGHFSVAAGSYVAESERILLLVKDQGQVDEAVRQLVRIGLDRVVAWMPVAEALGVDELVSGIERIEFSQLERSDLQQQSVLDVRGASEFASGHLQGAVNIAHTRLAARLDEVPAGKLLVHCAGGTRAAMATSYLQREGRDVIHVDGAFASAQPDLLE